MTKPSILLLARNYPFWASTHKDGHKEPTRELKAKHISARLNRDLALDLIQDGWDVTIVTLGGTKGVTTVQNDGQAKVIRVPVKQRNHYVGFLKIWFALYKTARSLTRHDIIISVSDTPFLAIAGARLAAQKQSAHVHWSHEILPELWAFMGYKLPRALLSWLDDKQMKALKATDHIVVSGRCMKDHLIYRGINAEQITSIPPWANADPGGAVKDDLLNDESKAPRHIDPTILFRVMYTGAISGATPISPLLDAAMAITKEHKDIEFVFVGDGAAFEKISALKARHGLDRIKLLPPAPLHHAATMMASGDVHIVSLKPEATGLTVPFSFYTAIAAHRPIVCIASRESEMGQLMSEYPCGDIVAPDNINQLQDYILKYRHDRHEWFNAHQAAIKAHIKFNHDTAREKWLRIIKSSFKPI